MTIHTIPVMDKPQDSRDSFEMETKTTNQESLVQSTQNIEELTEKIEDSLNIQEGSEDDLDENGTPKFPNELLARLDEMVNKPKWIIPVLPDAELEKLMDATISLSKKGLDTRSVECQKFVKGGMTISYNKILLDDAVNTWKYEIHKCIMDNTKKLIELCVVKLDQDWFPLMELLAIALNPNSRFHVYNAARQSEPFDQSFARSVDHRQPKGWVVDLINYFGQLGGFEKFKKRFCEMGNLNVPVIYAYIRPFGYCAELLTDETIKEYFIEPVLIMKQCLDSLPDDVLKKESKTESKNEAIPIIIKSMKSIIGRLAGYEELCKNLEHLRLQMILRLLQVSPFNGKMNALNEINRVIGAVSYYSHHRHHEEDEFLTHDMIAKWLQENEVLSVVMKDNLHQPQYVEKLEKIIRFTIKARTLTLKDLDTIWSAQLGKHEAIVKNVHDLLAKLAWDFSADQMDHLFSRFQTSWTSANKKQQEKLLELIRRLAEDDKEGVIAHKVLNLLWHLAHSDDIPTDIMDQALNAHIKILDYSCSQTQDRDSLKINWIHVCVNELREGVWVIPALKQIRSICKLFYEGNGQVSPNILYRNTVVESIQNKHAVVSLVAENLSHYMDSIREKFQADTTIDPLKLIPDGRYSHVLQIQERLDFLRFVLNDGKMWLCEPQAEQIWVCLATNFVFSVDRDVCFQWFSKVMGDDPDLDPDITKEFFEKHVLKIVPATLNEHGLGCFERFFKYVNMKEGVLRKKRNRTYELENIRLIGYDYLWKVIIEAPLEIANRGIEILKEIYTNLGVHLKKKQKEIHSYFINACSERLLASERILSEITVKTNEDKTIVQSEARKITLCLKALHEYVAESDNQFLTERIIPQHSRSFRGRQLCLHVRFTPQNRQIEEFEIWTHTNDSLASIRRNIHNRLKMSSQAVKLDLYSNGDLLSSIDDKKVLEEIHVKDRTIFTVKLASSGEGVPSSPDSSPESSPPVTPHLGDPESSQNEALLPGVILSQSRFTNTLFGLVTLADKYCINELRDVILSLLNLCPSDHYTILQLKMLLQKNTQNTLDNFFFVVSPIQVLYHLEILYALLLPTVDYFDQSLQKEFVKAGGIHCILKMFSTKFLTDSDMLIKRKVFNILFRIAKFLFTSVAFAHITVVAEALQKGSAKELTISSTQHNYAVVLQQAMQHIPNTYYEYMIRNFAIKLGQSTGEYAIQAMPDHAVIKNIQKICWCSSLGDLNLLISDVSEIHKRYENTKVEMNERFEEDYTTLAKEALEVLTIMFALCPNVLESFIKDQSWHAFVIDTILICRNRIVRQTAAEQFFLMATKCSTMEKPLRFFITLLFTVKDKQVSKYPDQSSEYFTLLCRLLHYGRSVDLQPQNYSNILTQELKWIQEIQKNHITVDSFIIQNDLLKGHLGITKELLAYHPSQKLFQVGSDENGVKLLPNLINYFVFSASRQAVSFRKGDNVVDKHVTPICNTSATVVAALDLIVTLSANCVANLRLLSNSLIELYYSGSEKELDEWEYQPPIGPRPYNGFVGLKNAGATCYMNSVLQQLYMIPEIRCGVLCTEAGYRESDDDEEIEDASVKESSSAVQQEQDKDTIEKQKKLERQQYNTKVLSHVQAIFGHLYDSKLQFYVPKGFWETFRLWGEPVNLREQHDAYEFFNTLVDNIDEGLKGAGVKTICSVMFGGSFADQKICKQCPHRYSRETPFTAINVDVRNHQNLVESLEQYVKGDLLEGANAYHCEKCDKKVDTVKRMCIKKLPKVLAFQLKRFDYDWERDCAVKFNDYFEFPRELDLEPFTVEGLAKIEGESIEENPIDDHQESTEKNECTNYRLMGVVVHSGQASGGHYYSYILPRGKIKGTEKWYKFDDGDVCECNMDDDEELKNQCFGGEYIGEVFEHMLKRRQKRWWNAYLLFYEREDVFSQTKRSSMKVTMPNAIERSVRKENIHFLHTNTHFSEEYFHFMKKLPAACSQSLEPVREELGLISLKLLCKFLFSVGLRSKKCIRGQANEWCEAVSGLVRQGISLRRWFVIEVLLDHPQRIVEYLIECPVVEIRSAFGRIVVLLAHLTRSDGEFHLELSSKHLKDWQVKGCDPKKSTLSDYLLRTIIEILHRDEGENGQRHLIQYFQLFVMYAGIGVPERKQLLDLGVLSTFIRLAIDEERSISSKYQYQELSKLYSLVSVLLRSCDVTKYMKSSNNQLEIIPNPFHEAIVTTPIMKIPDDVEGLIYTSNYVKKLLETSNTSEDTIYLIKFLSWECLNFSLIALSEVLFQISYAYTYELRPYLEILLHILLMNDSWQQQRLQYAFSGVSDDREGLFDTIHRSKSHSHKRGYQCIKAIVQLTQNCELAHNLLICDAELKRKWKEAIAWLGDELERRAPSTYNYNNWSPPTQSNETSNGYLLERSHSAKSTYRKACEIFDGEDEDGVDEIVENMDRSYDDLQIEDESPQRDNNASFGSEMSRSTDGICPPYSEIVLNNPDLPIEVNTTLNDPLQNINVDDIEK